jgi:multidrug transporter EmrE-like cation transporter
MDKTSFLLLAASAVTNAMGSTIMKHAYGGAPLAGSGIIGAALRILLNPWTIAGIGCFGISFFFMAAALSGTDLTLAYPMMSAMVYLILLFVGAFVFHEKITLMRIGGMAFILAGIAMLSA